MHTYLWKRGTGEFRHLQAECQLAKVMGIVGRQFPSNMDLQFLAIAKAVILRAIHGNS